VRQANSRLSHAMTKRDLTIPALSLPEDARVQRLIHGPCPPPVKRHEFDGDPPEAAAVLEKGQTRV